MHLARNDEIVDIEMGIPIGLLESKGMDLEVLNAVQAEKGQCCNASITL